MMKLLLGAAALMSMTGAAQAQGVPRSPAEVAQAFERNFNAGDIEGLSKLYVDGSVFIPAPGVVLDDAAKIRAGLTQFMASRVPIHLSVRHVYQAKDTALVVFDWTMQGKAADGTLVDMQGTVPTW